MVALLCVFRSLPLPDIKLNSSYYNPKRLKLKIWFESKLNTGRYIKICRDLLSQTTHSCGLNTKQKILGVSCHFWFHFWFHHVHISPKNWLQGTLTGKWVTLCLQCSDILPWFNWTGNNPTTRSLKIEGFSKQQDSIIEFQQCLLILVQTTRQSKINSFFTQQNSKLVASRVRGRSWRTGLRKEIHPAGNRSPFDITWNPLALIMIITVQCCTWLCVLSLSNLGKKFHGPWLNREKLDAVTVAVIRSVHRPIGMETQGHVLNNRFRWVEPGTWDGSSLTACISSQPTVILLSVGLVLGLGHDSNTEANMAGWGMILLPFTCCCEKNFPHPA